MRAGTYVAVATAAAGLLVAAVVLRPWEQGSRSETTARADAPARPGGVAGDDALAFQLRPESSRAYVLTFATTVTSAGSAPRETTLAGRLNVQVVTSGGGPALAVKLDPLEVEMDRAPQSAMSERYAVPFVVAIAPSGRLGALLFPAELPQGDRAVLDGLVRAFEVVLPASPRDAWEEEESDPVGTFVASYRRGPAGTIERVKVRYTAVHPPPMFAVRVLASTVRAEVDAAGPWLARIDGIEELQLTPGSGLPDMRVRTRFSLQPAGAPSPSAASALARAVSTARVGVDAGPLASSAWDETEREATRRRFQASGITLDRLAERARSAHLPAPALTHELAAYFRAYPESAAQVRVEDVGDAAAAILLNALELAGTPEAQQALLDVAEGGGHSHDNRIRALAALSGVEAPDGDTIERLERDARAAGAGDRTGIASMSLLTLGALAPKAPDEERQRIVRELADSLRGATDPREEALLLLALENARAPLSADAVASHLASPDAQVRLAAARLAVYAAGGDTTGALVEALGREPDARVREAILDCLLLRPSDPRANAAVAAALTGGGEPNASVRVRMVAYLASQLTAFPQNRELLSAYVSREPDRAVTVAILNAIAR